MMMICTNKELILKNVTFDMSTNIGHYSNITVAHWNTICMAALIGSLCDSSFVNIAKLQTCPVHIHIPEIRAKEQKYPTKNLLRRLLHLSVLDCCYKILLGKVLNFFVHQDSYQ